jgi:DUF1009 family protein
MPRQLVKALAAQKRSVFIVAFEGVTDPALCQNVPCVWLKSLGQIGAALKALKKADAKTLVMAGAFPRPRLRELKLDIKGALWLPAFLKAPRGDDGWLRTLSQKLAAEGFSVKGPQDFLPQLLAPEGSLGTVLPSKEVLLDIEKGFAVLDALSPFDIGQALVIEDGWVLGIEAAEGTDELIQRCGPLQRLKGRAVLVKTKKTRQDERLDLPGLGVKTLQNLHKQGFAGCAFRAGQALLMDLDAFRREADRLGVFVYGAA